VAVVFGGEESAQRGADRGAVSLRDDPQVAVAAPTFVVSRELRVRDHELVRRQLPLGIPGDGFDERAL
jgi:hypothetical protein